MCIKEIALGMNQAKVCSIFVSSYIIDILLLLSKLSSILVVVSRTCATTNVLHAPCTNMAFEKVVPFIIQKSYTYVLRIRFPVQSPRIFSNIRQKAIHTLLAYLFLSSFAFMIFMGMDPLSGIK